MGKTGVNFLFLNLIASTAFLLCYAVVTGLGDLAVKPLWQGYMGVIILPTHTSQTNQVSQLIILR